MIQWLNLSDDVRRQSVSVVAEARGLPVAAVEKDWWVTLVLRAIFSTPYRPSLIFKGGTSLSKGWDLISRLSEDIDLALDRHAIDAKYAGELGNRALTRLRNDSVAFVTGPLKEQIVGSLIAMGLPHERLEVTQEEGNHPDPHLLVNYQSLYDPVEYLPSRVKIEVSTRSLREPFAERPIQSFIGSQFQGQEFADAPFNIPTVEPKRTFLEKACLLHEEFLRPVDDVRVHRMSRHLYDLEKMMDTDHGREALADLALYRNVIDHRANFYSRSHVDYATLAPGRIDFIPPACTRERFLEDYNSMAETMFYSEQLTFPEVIARLEELRNRFRQLNF